MKDIVEYVKEWNAESSKDGFERYVSEKCDEAKEIGIKQGKKEGKKEGKEESKLKIAKNMLVLNVAPNDIIKYTGISKNQLDRLINKGV